MTDEVAINFTVEIINRVGMPVAIILFSMFGLWKIGKFLSPHIATWFEGQGLLMVTLRDTVEKQANTQCRIADTLDKLDAKIDGLTILQQEFLEQKRELEELKRKENARSTKENA